MGKSYLNDYKESSQRLGQQGINTDGDLMEIIKYRGYDDIDVLFLDGNDCIVRTQYVNFLKGIVKNYNKVRYGKHGYLGQGKYVTEYKDENGKRNYMLAYQKWNGMHRRAYNSDGKHPAYADVHVDREWWNYQVFAEWFENNYYEVPNDFLCLDKDIKYPGNRIYSPHTCILIPNSINELFKQTNCNEKGLPIGVYERSDMKSIRYRARTKTINENNEIIDVSLTTKTAMEAFNFYKTSRERYIQFMANMYKDYLPKDIYHILMTYDIKPFINKSSDC